MNKQDLVQALDGDQANELDVLLELSALLSQLDLSTSELLGKAAALLLRLLRQMQPDGALIQWRGEQYIAGKFGHDSYRLRATLTANGDSESFIAVSVDEHFPNAAKNHQSISAQTALEHAAAVISLSLEHRELESERDALRIRKQLLERIISHSPVIAFIWDPSDGWPVRFVSDNIERLGYQAADFESGKIKYEDIIHPDDRKRIVAEVEANLASGCANFEQRYRILTQSGEVRLMRDWTMVSRNNENKVVTIEGVIQDITSRIDADERARRQLELTNNIFLVVDSEGLVVDVNDKTCELVEMERNELLGTNWLENFVPDDARATVQEYFEQNTLGKIAGVQEFENDIVSASGERYRIHWYHSLEFDQDGHPGNLIAFGADVSEMRESENQSRKHTQLLMHNPNPVLSLSNDGDVAVANSAAQKLLNDIAEGGYKATADWQQLVAKAIKPGSSPTKELMVGDQAYVFMVSRQAADGYVNLYGLDVSEEKELSSRLRSIADNIPGAVFEYTLAPGGTDTVDYINSGCEDIWEISADELVRNPTALWEVVDPADLPGMRQSVLESARNLDHWVHEWRIMPRSGKLKWLRGAGTPEKHADGSVGWTTIVIDITATKIAQQAVSEALRKTIYVLSAALEARDPYTAGHEQRVTTIAVQIGRELGLDQTQLTGLELAAMVHDVGKIRVPAEILSKPGRLTKEEFELIKTHPAVGAELLKGIDFDWPISDFIRQHHERMDGSGYPDGLAGDEICLEARIIAVADTLEAMASHRPYRPGLGIEKAAAEIREGAGTRYDERVAQACLLLIEDGSIDLSPASVN